MANLNDVYGLLGLARKASRLVIGDEATQDLIRAGHARAVLVASDAGAVVQKKVLRQAQEASVLVLYLPDGKETLGAALGRASCSVCALSDTGFASAAAQKLKSLSADNAKAAILLDKKHARMLERRAKPRKKDAGKKVTEYIDIEEDAYLRHLEKEEKKKKRE